MRKFLLGLGILVSLAIVLGFGFKVRSARQVASLTTGTQSASTFKLSSSPFQPAVKTASTPAKTLLAAGSASTQSAIAQNYGKLPLAFEPNVGQTDPQAKYLARGDGYTLFLTSNEAVLSLAARTTKHKPDHPAPRMRGHKKAKKQHSSLGTHADSRNGILRMELAGANASPKITAQNQLPGITNYFIGTSDNWHSNVPTFSKVSEQDVYPGIDLVYYGSQRQLEYDFVVAPGADPRAIRLSIDGATNLSTSAQGDLQVAMAGGEVAFRKPVAYQWKNGAKQIVAANYKLSSRHDVTFALGTYDAKQPLIIDPILAYSTYLGGSDIDGANAIAVASDKTAFIAGGTSSVNFPTAHALQPIDGGSNDFPKDAFVAKFSADGSTLFYSTYLGGGNDEVANGIAVDTVGNAYVVGNTDSPDYPITFGAFDTLCGGDGQCGASWNTGGLIVTNGFITVLNPAGSGIVYSAFVGVYENVSANAVAVDQNRVAYIAGKTGANITPTVTITPPATGPAPFPISGNAAQTAYGGGATDAFVMAISATGSSVLYSTYLGGSGEDVAYGVAADSSSNAYVTGLTYSSGFPVKNAFQAANGGEGDAFLTEVNTSGAVSPTLVYSTMFGGTGLDQGNGIALDAANNAYIAGGTSSAGLAGSPVAYGGQGDAFVAKFTTTASGAASLDFFTYLGGTLNDSASGIGLDPAGNIYVTGSTVSPDFPTTTSGFQTAYGGGNDDAFVTKLDPTGATILYSSYLGGTNTDNAYGIAVDTDGSAYVAGQTCSLDFPLSNPEQPVTGGDCDAFISKVSILNGIALNPAGLTFPAQSLNTTSGVETVTVTNGDSATTITSISLTGTNPGDFAENNNCPNTLTPGEQCTISVTFTPTANGLRRASVTINDSAPGSPQVISLTGSTSTLTLSASVLNFGNQAIGVASAPQSVTATNDGTSTLTFSSITASGDYSETDNCAVPLQPGTNCTINVVYTPSAAGSSVGALTLTDNAPGSPQIVQLTGTGVTLTPDFSLTSTPPSATINAGQSATFTLFITAINGFNLPVELSATGVPKDATLTVSANPAPAGTAAAPTQVTLVVKTGSRTMVPFAPRSTHPSQPLRPIVFTLLMWLACLMAAAILFTMMTGKMQGQRATAALVFAVMLIMLSVACNGGTQSGTAPGTPAGTYQIVITGTSTGATHSTTVNLQVN